MTAALGNNTEFWALPDGTTEWVNIRRTDGDMDKQPTYTKSAEIQTGGQAAQNALTQTSVQGSINHEFPLADPGLEIMLESVCRSSFSADLAINASTISFDNGAGTIDDSGNGFGSVVAGQIIGVFNATNATNNRVYRVETAAAGQLTVFPAPPVTEAAGATVDIKGRNMRNSNVEQPFTLQKRVPYTGGVDYRNNTGTQVTQFDITIQPGALVTSTSTMLGTDATASDTQNGGTTDLASQVDKVLGAVGIMPHVFIDSTEITPEDDLFTDMSMTIGNGGAENFVVNKAGAACLSFGDIVVGGTLNSFAQNTSRSVLRSVLDKLDNSTRFDMTMVLQDSDGNYMAIRRPQTIYTAATQPPTANGLMVNNGTVDSEKGSDGYTLQIDIIETP